MSPLLCRQMNFDLLFKTSQYFVFMAPCVPLHLTQDSQTFSEAIKLAGDLDLEHCQSGIFCLSPQ